MAEIEEFSANPEKESSEVGFDVLLIPNADLNIEDEDAVAAHLQTKIPAYQGKNHKYSPVHNQNTAHRADVSSELPVIAVLAPRHLNMRRGDRDIQKGRLDKHNDDKTTQASLRTGNSIVFLTHALTLVSEGAIDVKGSNYDVKRIWATDYKDVLAKPVNGYVPGSFVGDDGQVYRDRADVGDDSPSRALVVPKA